MALLILATTSCLDDLIASREERKKEEWLYSIDEGEEALDFLRFATWVENMDGRFPLEPGSKMHWFESSEFRCYSNDNHVIVFTPRRFHEEFGTIVWIAGGVSNSGNFVENLYPFISTNHIGVQTGNLRVAPEACRDAGLFSARFGDSRERLLDLVRKSVWESPDSIRREYLMDSHRYTHRVVYKPVLPPGHQCNTRVDFRLDANGSLYWMEIINYPGGINIPYLSLLRNSELPVVRRGSFTIENVVNTPAVKLQSSR